GAAAATCDFDREMPLLRDQSTTDGAAIEEAMREGVRDAYHERGEPVREDFAAAAALQSLSAEGLLVPLALARAGGVSELELFVDHFRSALADGRRSDIERIKIADEPEEYAYVVKGAHDVTPLDDRVEWSVWGVLSATREVDTRSLLRRTYALFRGAETPDRELIEQAIASYAVQSEEGGWRLGDVDSLVARQASQSQLAAERAALLQQKLERSAPLSDIVRRRGWRFVKWRPLRGFLANGGAALDGLEAVLGLEPAVEQRGHQLVFKW